MPITLTITDGTDTVSFNDGTTLSLSDSFQMNVGTGGSVTELVMAGWHITGANTKATTVRKYNHLIRKAVRHYRERLVDKAVWLTWKPDDQTGTQYAKVQGGTIIEVDTYTIGGREGGIFAPEIIREAEWRSQPPDGTAGALLYGAQSVRNKKDLDGQNWLDHTSRSTEAPGLLEFQIEASQDYGEVLIARKLWINAGTGNNFNPWFNAADQFSAHPTTAETAAPADLKIVFTTSNTIDWAIPAAAVPHYRGRYQVFAWSKIVSGSGTATATLLVDNVTVSQPIPLDTAPVGRLGRLYLTTINLPFSQRENTLKGSSTSSQILLSLIITINGTATVDTYGIWLVPIDDGVFHLTAASDIASSTQDLMVDSINGIAYLAEAADITKQVYFPNPLTPSGTYPIQEGNILNRFYFYFADGGEHEFNDTYQITARIVDRWYALRGNQ